MLKAHAGLPIRHFEGAPSFAPSSDDPPVEDHEKEQDPKKKSDIHGKENGTKGVADTEKNSTAAANTASSTHTPSSAAEAPEPGMGVEKGKN